MEFIVTVGVTGSGLHGCFNILISLITVLISEWRDSYQISLSHPFGESLILQLRTFFILFYYTCAKRSNPSITATSLG